MRCSSDLRKRVLDDVRGGGSKAAAARRFQVSRASVYTWLKAPDGRRYVVGYQVAHDPAAAHKPPVPLFGAEKILIHETLHGCS